MPKIPMAACAMGLRLAMPAFAQNSMSGTSTSTSTMSSSSTAMTCDQMMKQADRMTMSATGARMTMAQNERHMAFMAKTKNDDAGCKMHMEKAMKLMK